MIQISTFVSVGATFLLIGLSFTRSSGQERPGRERDPGDQEAARAALFERFDENADGKLDREEVPQGLSRRFDDVDADEDGSLDAEEFGRLFGRQRPAGEGNAGAVPAERIARLFSRNDADGDGEILPGEASEFVKARFAEFDQNSDGVVDREEFEAVAPRFLRGPGRGAPGGRERLFGALLEQMISQQADRYWPQQQRREWPLSDQMLPVEPLAGDGVWVDPTIEGNAGGMIPVTVWFNRQFLCDGEGFERRADELAGQRRQELGARVVDTLKTLSEQSYRDAEESMRQLAEDEEIALVRWHWIVNGFSCFATDDGVAALTQVPGVKKIFRSNQRLAMAREDDRQPTFFEPAESEEFDPERFQHPWYSRYLLADRTWNELEVSGRGTLNVVMDGNFVFSPNVTRNLYRNPGEIPGNGVDDDQNGLVDDYHGYNFSRNDPLLEVQPAGPDAGMGQLHGFTCISEICGAGTDECPFEFGLAPSANWAGVIVGQTPEPALEWAIEQGADTLSMSFSMPNLGEFRSHWRKMMEHATFCGLCCVSGAGNFAREGSSSFAPIPVQMRIPEDIPAVFSAAGVQRSFERTPFSSQGPVEWETEYYQQGLVDKPDFCAFNFRLPRLLPDGEARPSGASGNSFAGPMLAGTLALMMSADPDLLPWDARQILVDTAGDVGPEGFDHQTGHGLLNCYRAVREVLRRKNFRDGGDPRAYEGREQDDALDVAAIQQELQEFESMFSFALTRIQPGSPAETAGLRDGDVLESMNGTAIEAQSDIESAIEQSRESDSGKIVFGIRRDGQELELEVLVPKEGRIGFGFAAQRTPGPPAFE